MSGPTPVAARCGRAMLVVATLVYAATLVPGVRAERGYVAWADGYLSTGIIVLAAVLALARAAHDRVEGAAWLAVGAALSVYAVGDSYYNLALSGMAVQPYPSPADACWLITYVGLTAGVI